MKRILLILAIVGLTGLLVGCPPVPDPDLAPPSLTAPQR